MIIIQSLLSIVRASKCCFGGVIFTLDLPCLVPKIWFFFSSTFYLVVAGLIWTYWWWVVWLIPGRIIGSLHFFSRTDHLLYLGRQLTYYNWDQENHMHGSDKTFNHKDYVALLVKMVNLWTVMCDNFVSPNFSTAGKHIYVQTSHSSQ